MQRLLGLGFLILLAGCNVYGFGDSITAETPGHNASWIYRMDLPEWIGIEEHGQPWATCQQVYENFWTDAIEADEWQPLDVVVVMCHTPSFELVSLEETLWAVLEMYAEAREHGLQFVFATQPAWHIDSAWQQPDSREFYDALFEVLPPQVLKIDNDQLWKDEGWNLDPANYTDGVHMSEQGGEILGATMRERLCGGSVVLLCEWE